MRAKATVDAIVEATTQLLMTDGYDQFTTSRVAERAGVSIGSLYQYFPNKNALAAAVIDRCCQDFVGGFSNALARRARTTLAGLVEALMDVGFVSHPQSPKLHRIVNELGERIGMTDRIGSIRRATTELIEAALHEHADEIAPGIDFQMAAVIIEIALEAMSHQLWIADPPSDRRNTFLIEVSRLITNYLGR